MIAHLTTLLIFVKSGFKKMPFFFKRANYLNILLIQELQKIVIEHTENQMENG